MLSSLAGQFRAFNTARFTIHEDEATIRIDRALRERLQVPQSYVQRAIRNREVLLNKFFSIENNHRFLS